MGRKVNFCIKTNNDEIYIPFNSLEAADLFTMRYEKRVDLLSNLIEILNLPIEMDDIVNAYLCYNKEDGKWLAIRYTKDNYNVDSLIDSYSTYLKTDQNRLNGYGIRNVVSILVPDFVPGCLNDRYIDLIARRYLDNSYKKIRDVYFLIKKHIKVKIDDFSDKRDKSIDRNGLNQMTNYEDEYIKYLMELASSNEDEFQYAAEELAMMGLDEIERRLNGKYFSPVIDGMGYEEYLGANSKDIYSLEKATGLSIYELKDVIYSGKCRRRRK